MPEISETPSSTDLDANEPSFGEFSRSSAHATNNRKRSRLTLAIYSIIALAVIGTTLAVILSSPKSVDPNAPRVTLHVDGMHCPIQCGVRVSNSLEQIPWIIPGSITANPATGEVTFVVTNQQAVNREELREAIEKAGFNLD